MTKQQQRRVIAILRKDCKAVGRFMCADGATCAVGALVLETGYSKRKLKRITGGLCDLPLKVVDALERKFGLDRDMINNVIEANDANHSVAERRAATVAVIKNVNVE